MEYWSANYRLNDLNEWQRQSKIHQLLRRLSLPGEERDFDYFVAYRTDDSPSAPSPVMTQYFSTFQEAREWWAGLSRNSFRLSDGNRLCDRISGTKQELISALGKV